MLAKKRQSKKRVTSKKRKKGGPYGSTIIKGCGRWTREKEEPQLKKRKFSGKGIGAVGGEKWGVSPFERKDMRTWRAVKGTPYV